MSAAVALLVAEARAHRDAAFDAVQELDGVEASYQLGILAAVLDRIAVVS